MTYSEEAKEQLKIHSEMYKGVIIAIVNKEIQRLI